MIRPGQLRPRSARLARKAVPKQDGRLSRGEVRTRKRMAEVGAVFDITPVPRTAGRTSCAAPAPGQARGPKAAGKWLTASVAASAADVVAAVFAEADRRDPGHQRTWVALADGNKDQIAVDPGRGRRPRHHHHHPDRLRPRPGIPLGRRLVLLPRSQPRPPARGSAPAPPPSWTAAPPTSPPPSATSRRPGLQRGQAQDRRRRPPATSTPKPPTSDYPAALAAGWPISTGVIEGACRYLVKDRMDITGARWGVDDRRSHPQTPRPARQRRLRRLLGLPPPARTPAQPPRHASYTLAA